MAGTGPGRSAPRRLTAGLGRMFKRKNPLPPHHRVKAWLLPSGGYRRAARYLAHRVGRLPGTPYRIAAGLASGAAVSMTPFIGFHFVLAILLSLAVRGNLIASAVGTVIGNPWTFPFIWAWTYALGHWLLGKPGFELPIVGFTISGIFDSLETVFWPMLLGSLPTALVAWLTVFFTLRSVVAQYQRTRRGRLRRRARRLRIVRRPREQKLPATPSE